MSDQEGEQLTSLVDEALQDRVLRQSAYTVGLDRDALVEMVLVSPPKLDSVGLEERSMIESARHELIDAQAVDHRAERSMRWMRGAAIVLEVAVIAATISLTIWFALEGAVAAAVISGIGVAILGSFGLVCLVEWPSYWLYSMLGSPGDRTRRAEAEVARQQAALRAVLLEAEIKPALRSYVNSLESNKYRVELTHIEQEGLAELEDPRYAIPTRAREQLDRFMEDMPGGSIGLSGPRGVGKTTLIRSVCPAMEGGTKERFGLVVAAPVEFDPREFLLFLFSETCRAMLGAGLVEQMRRPDPLIATVMGPSLVRRGLPLAVAMLPLIGLATILSTFVSWSGFAAVTTGTLILLAAYPLFLLVRRGGLLVVDRDFYFDFWSRSQATGLSEQLLRSAANRLERIWYQQTYTTGWSGALKAPVAEGGLKASRELASQQMTLPELVGEFRRLLTDIAKDRRVMIGIDELDKIESRKKAYRFMNEMKVLFGAEGCFFLISVSEDAMSVFERRGLPFRDVFDSSFDDVVNVGFLDVDESVALLQRRLIGMPLPFIFLCHSVAGGLARDLIRVAREVVVLRRSFKMKGGEARP